MPCRAMPIRSVQYLRFSRHAMRAGIPTPFDSWHGRNGRIIVVAVVVIVGCDRSQSALGGLANPNTGSLPQPGYPNIIFTSNSF